MHRTVPPSKAT